MTEPYKPCFSDHAHDLVFISSIDGLWRTRACVRCDYTEIEEPEPEP